MRADDKLVTIRRCGPIWEAEMIRDRLEAAGLRAFVQGAETTRMLSYVGTALGGVRVQVPASEVEAAEQVLLADEHQRETAGPWQCPRCDEPNEASFDVCWSCAMPRDETPPMPGGANAQRLVVEAAVTPAKWTDADASNPYQSVLFEKSTTEPESRGLTATRFVAGGLLAAMLIYMAVAVASHLAALFGAGQVR